MKVKVKKGQIYRNVTSDTFVEIIGTKGSKWKVRKLTDNPKKFNGSHTLHPRTLTRGYKLVE